MNEILKADLHLHTAEDRSENIEHDAYRLLDEAHRQGFDVISITNHDTFTFNRKLRDYASKLEILLLPGVELTVEGRHVLILGDLSGVRQVKQLKDLYKLKREETLLIAPHPFFPASRGLGKSLFACLDLFDVLEYCHCYTRLINFNRLAVSVAEKEGLPMASFSDSHMLWQFGRSYSLLLGERSPEGVFSALRGGAVQMVTSPLDPLALIRTIKWIVPGLAGKLLDNTLKRRSRKQAVPEFTETILDSRNSG